MASARRLGHQEETGTRLWMPHSGTKQDGGDFMVFGLFNESVSLSTTQQQAGPDTWHVSTLACHH